MAKGRVRFGIFEFELGSLQLRRHQTALPLQTQPARVLARLLESAGHPVSREQLCEAVWGSETNVDFERGLNFCISQLRAALKDNATQPVYIRTLPKHGYEFISPLEWLASGSSKSNGRKTLLTRFTGVPASVALGVICLAAGAITMSLFRPRPTTISSPVVAVARFDNETGNPQLSLFADALTDTVVERLASRDGGHYRVIGNAQILQVPREQRNLTAIASQLRANYVVLGQVQANGGETRILAHLIRMPEQTHLSVVRVERRLDDPLSIEAEAAQRIADQFSPRVFSDASASLVTASH